MDYRLTFLAAPTFLLNQAELQQITNTNSELCERLSLSGLFLYLNGSILEIIEGTQESIDQYFNLIESYKWHGKLIVIGRESIDQKLFDSYLIAYKLPSTTNLDNLTIFLSTPDLYGQVNEPNRTLLSLITNFHENNLNN